MAYDYSPKTRELIMGALDTAHPNTYGLLLGQGMERRVMTANQAMAYPLSGGGYTWISQMQHDNQAAPQWGRDARLRAWLEACQAQGGVLHDALAGQYDGGSGMSKGVLSLMKSQAFDTLRWYQAQGLEQHLTKLGKNEGTTTLFELALFHGQPQAGAQFMPTTPLLHSQRLWQRIWHKSCVGRLTETIALLEHVTEPPKDVLDGLPEADINLGNIDNVIKHAERFVEMGRELPRTQEGRTPLGRAVESSRSPASAKLVAWLMKHGQNPMEETRSAKLGDDWSGSALELALRQWTGCSIKSQLRDSFKEMVEIMAVGATREARAKVFTAQRVDDLAAGLRKHETRTSQWSVKTAWTPDEDIAWLRRMALDASIQAKVSDTQGRERKRTMM